MKTAITTPLAMFEDSTLIKLALAGRVECFTLLMDRHLFAVRRHIGSMVRDPTDTDDLVQEVLLKVWRHLSKFRSESSFRTWMTRVAINEVLQSYRRKQHSPLFQALPDLDAIASPGDCPHKSLARTEAIKTIRHAVAELPATYRQVLILRDLEQLTARETAESLQSTVPAVKTRLFRARLLLSATLRRSRIQTPANQEGGKNSTRASVADRP